VVTCAGVYKHICDHLDENLSSPRCRAIHRHLKTCPECAAYLASLKTTVRLYRRMPVPPRTAGSRRLVAHTLRVVLAQEPRTSARRRRS
jgi:anti-sigma factor RsiW